MCVLWLSSQTMNNISVLHKCITNSYGLPEGLRALGSSSLRNSNKCITTLATQVNDKCYGTTYFARHNDPTTIRYQVQQIMSGCQVCHSIDSAPEKW